MAEPLKNLYNDKFFNLLTISCEESIPDFNSEFFLKDIYDKDWENRELKERLRHITLTLKKQLPDDYLSLTNHIIDLILSLKENGAPSDSFEYAFLPDFIHLSGVEHFDTSVQAMEKITQFVTCEFAVRPFLVKYPEKMMRQMLLWSEHDHPSVRRLASEGCRPRLPWALGVPSLKKDPSPILPILENLKNDISETVRRSVANNLNDISKDHPECVIGIAKKWIGNSENTNKLVKHACRTLLKEGNLEVMSLFGYGSSEDILISNFTIHTPTVHTGEHLEFSFDVTNKSKQTQKVRIEYGVYYLRANGSHSRKVFKISEKEYPANSVSLVERRQSFKPVTTRTLYPGIQKLSVIINGNESKTKQFRLN